MRGIFFMRWLVLVGLAFCLGLADSRAQNYPTPGFDCANASSPQELRICRSPQLGELDGRHWYLAERVIKGSPDPEKVRAEVEGWIGRVRNVCETDKCLVDAYTTRLFELERGVAALAPVRPAPLPARMPQAAAPEVFSPAPAETRAPSPVAVPASAPKPQREPEPEDHEALWPWLLAAALVAAVAIVVAKR